MGADASSGTVDKIPPMSAGDATHGVAGPCWSLLSRGWDNLAAEAVSGCAVARPSCGNLSADGELEWTRKVVVRRPEVSPISLVVDGSGGGESPTMMFVSEAGRRPVPRRSVDW
jgi:hypothetical protein